MPPVLTPDRERLAEGAAAPLVPAGRDLDVAREAAAVCTACHLWQVGTQTVFGEGPTEARLMLVGEQPGDQEDLQGRPFVGPAGRLLDAALAEAGIDRASTYVTNVVKHFKWEARGKRRIHEKPNAAEVDACGPWLVAEIEAVQPRVLIALGATAAQALISPSFRVTRERGRLVESRLAPHVLATIHPSAILRTSDPELRRLEYQRFVEDLRVAAPLMAATVA